jgi:DNA-binding NarL/FixJ family response regulator
VDDHPVVREGLRLRLSAETDMEVCGEAADPGEALRLIAAQVPDVAIIDISLENGNGLDLIKRVKDRHPSVRMLVWSMHEESHYAERALRAGARGYVNKKSATDVIIQAIHQVREGKLFLSESAASQILQRAVGSREPAVASPVETLSDRELEVFELIGEGLNTPQIADKMHLSPKTVETYRARIKEKLHIASASELARRATEWVLERQ